MPSSPLCAIPDFILSIVGIYDVAIAVKCVSFLYGIITIEDFDVKCR